MKILDIPRSGSYAGIVSSHNRAGQYVRNRRAPVQPIGTGRRAIARGFFSSSATGYAALTTSQQDAWATFANTHPVTDSLGQTIILTGQQMFIRVNSSSLNAGLGPITAPPTDLALPDLSTATFTIAGSTGATIDNYSGPSGSKLCFGFSQQVSPARRFWKTFWQPFGAAGIGPGDAPPYTLAHADYEAQFGPLVAGNRVFVRVTPLSSQGWNGTGVVFSALVT